MTRPPTSPLPVQGLLRPALCCFVFHLLAAVLAAQCTNPTPVPNQTISSGTTNCSDNNALKAAQVTVNGSASVAFVAGNCIELGPGFRATAGTDPTTFHAWVETVPSFVSVSPSSGSGLSQAFTWTVSSPSGYSNLAEVQALFNTTITGVNACYIRYIRASNLLSVTDNLATNWSAGIAPGSSATTGGFNPNCIVNGVGSSVSGSGTQLTVTVSVTFPSTFSGTKNQYLIAYDNEGLNTTWQQYGTWTVNNPGPFTPIRISSAGNYTDSLGQAWSADAAYVDHGSTWVTNSTITGTPDPMLYQTERWNQPTLAYQFSVPNGSYTVTLKFAEIFDTAPGQRYMNIALNGTIVVTNFDVWTSAGGPNRAYDLSYPVSVTNGLLTLTLTCTSPNNSAEVNSIQIVATPQQYYLTTSVSPSGGGTISPGSGPYNSGTVVPISVNAASGYVFSGFTGNLSGTATPQYLTMNGPMAATAILPPAGFRPHCPQQRPIHTNVQQRRQLSHHTTSSVRLPRARLPQLVIQPSAPRSKREFRHHVASGWRIVVNIHVGVAARRHDHGSLGHHSDSHQRSARTHRRRTPFADRSTGLHNHCDPSGGTHHVWSEWRLQC